MLEDSKPTVNESHWTISVPEAGRKYFRIGTRASYAAASRGEIPTIKIGGLLRVPVHAIEKKLIAV